VIENNVTIDQSVICDKVVIGAGAVIPRGCVLSYGVVIGAGAVLKEYTRVSRHNENDSEDEGVSFVVYVCFLLSLASASNCCFSTG